MSPNRPPRPEPRAAGSGVPVVEITDAPREEDIDAIRAGLIAFNTARAGTTERRPLVVLHRDPSGAVAGGLVGRTSWGWLYVELLWVADHQRGAGVGRALLRAAEGEAVRRGCHAVWLDTFGFQAPGFYERLGYAPFGVLDDYPPGHRRHFLSKRLGPGPG